MNDKNHSAAVVTIYTDGACKGNPGIGGWGALLSYKNRQKSIFGGERQTTNNRMELMAAIKALRLLKRPCQVALWTDSSYVKKGISEWIHIWKKNNWKTAAKKLVVNQDLWQQLDALCQQHQIEWYWVKGHAGHPGNEIADQLANQGVESVLASSI